MELIKIFEKFTIEDVPDIVESEIIKDLNSNTDVLNSMLLDVLNILDDALTELNKEEGIIANSHIEYILAMELTAKSILLVIKHKKDLIKIEPSRVEAIKINASSIINAVEQISEIQSQRIKKLDVEELLVVLTS